MGQSPYHSQMIEHIRRFGSETPKKYLISQKGAENPIYLHHSQSKRKKISPMQYEPDVYFTNRKKSRIVFEVLDSEYEKTSEMLADMIQCCIAKDVTYLIFIVPVSDEKKKNNVYDTYDILTDALIGLGLNPNWPQNLAVYDILRSEARSYAKVRKILSQVSKEDKW